MHEISVRDAADLLRVSEKTIYRWLRQGVIPSIKFQGQYRFDRDELQAWATHKRIGSAPELGAAHEETVQLSRAVARGGIYHGIAGDTPESVYSNLAQHVPFEEEGEGLRGILASALIERESLASTGIGHGIALPHPRHPRDWGLGEPVCCIFLLEHPVEFKALDGQPVHVLFVLLCATVKGHLRMLAQVSHLVNNAAMQTFLRATPGANELMDRIAHAGTDPVA
ncbi:MAG: PTS sugar transporter subunit IIA [Candidatus Lambdaproteobacteria bacterium]|nr:PTS sugar transporter subunit IIA [Candidatus Lambdaproteobacteria bacterium]